MIYNQPQMGRPKKNNKHLPRHLHLKDGWYYYVIRLNGKDKWYALKTQNENEALQRWVTLETSVGQLKSFNPEKVFSCNATFKEAASLYEKDITPQKAARTIRNEKRMLRCLNKEFGDKKLAAFQADDITGWYDELKVNTPYEANRRLSLLRQVLKHANKAYRKEGLKLDIPYLFSMIEKAREKRFKLRLTIDILFLQIYPVAEHMLKRAIMLAFHFTQHENEIKKLKWTDFNLTEKKVKFIRQKTDEEIVINYSENLTLTAFLIYVQSSRRELSPYVICRPCHTKGWKPFDSFRYMWHRALKEAGYEKGQFKFKEIRHLSNTIMKEKNVTVEKRMAMTGHKHIATNEIYTHPTGNETIEAGRALSDFGPRAF